MKFSLFFALSVASVAAEEGKLRKLQAQGSIAIPCFSEVASVQVFGEGAVSMKDLKVGDSVFTGQTYEPVYAFAHLDKNAPAEFVQIHTSKGATLEATGAHMVFVDGTSDAVRADSVKVGDVLQDATVTKIGSVQRTGLYAPLTMGGKVVVDGVKASNYISLEQAEGHALFDGHIHAFSHFGISPFRLLCTKVSSKVCESYNEEGIPSGLAAIHQSFEWFMELPSVLQAFAIAVYLVIAAAAWTMEIVMTPLFGFVAVGALVAKASGFRIQSGKSKTV